MSGPPVPIQFVRTNKLGPANIARHTLDCRRLIASWVSLRARVRAHLRQLESPTVTGAAARRWRGRIRSGRHGARNGGTRWLLFETTHKDHRKKGSNSPSQLQKKTPPKARKRSQVYASGRYTWMPIKSFSDHSNITTVPFAYLPRTPPNAPRRASAASLAASLLRYATWQSGLTRMQPSDSIPDAFFQVPAASSSAAVMRK